jgi:hypothetical protein
VSNHPQLAGGSHLPDITVITPVWDSGAVVFWVASRGHHADIGAVPPLRVPVSVTTVTLTASMFAMPLPVPYSPPPHASPTLPCVVAATTFTATVFGATSTHGAAALMCGYARGVKRSVVWTMRRVLGGGVIFTLFMVWRGVSCQAASHRGPCHPCQRPSSKRALQSLDSSWSRRASSKCVRLMRLPVCRPHVYRGFSSALLLSMIEDCCLWLTNHLDCVYLCLCLIAGGGHHGTADSARQVRHSWLLRHTQPSRQLV